MGTGNLTASCSARQLSVNRPATTVRDSAAAVTDSLLTSSGLGPRASGFHPDFGGLLEAFDAKRSDALEGRLLGLG